MTRIDLVAVQQRLAPPPPRPSPAEPPSRAPNAHPATASAAASRLAALVMTRRVFGSDYRAVLWKLTSGKPPTTLPADNLDDPEVYLLAKGLAEVVHGRSSTSQIGWVKLSHLVVVG